MKTKSIFKSLLLTGVVSSIACTTVFADQNKKAEGVVPEKGIKIIQEIGENDKNEEVNIKTIDGNGTSQKLNLNDFKKLKFSKENGKIFYEGKEGKQELKDQTFDANTAEVTEDGSLYYKESNGTKMKLEMYEGAYSNGQPIVIRMSSDIK